MARDRKGKKPKGERWMVGDVKVRGDKKEEGKRSANKERGEEGLAFQSGGGTNEGNERWRDGGTTVEKKNSSDP